MATLVTLGLSEILGKNSEPSAGDFQETGYSNFGLTYEDTCKMSQDDPETTEFYAEEEDDPVESIEKQGKITFAFSIMNPDLTTLTRLFGGTVASDVYAYPDTVSMVEESVIIKPRKGLMFQVPRMKLVSKINGEFSKKGLLLIEVTGTVLKPQTTGLKKMYVKQIAAQSNSSSGSGNGN